MSEIIYAHRRADAVVINTTIDAEAVEVLRHYCPPGRRATGKFLARLIFEHDARMQERARIREILSTALDGASVVRAAPREEDEWPGSSTGTSAQCVSGCAAVRRGA